MLKKSFLILALGATAVVPVGALFAPTPVYAQQAKLNPKVGTPLEAAVTAANKGQFKQALDQIKAAEAASGKSAFEQFKINETYGFVYLKQKNYQAAAAAYERSLASNQLPAGQVNDRIKQLAQLNFQAPRNLPKVIEYSTRYLKAVNNDASMHAMLGQAYQLQGNHKAAIASVQDAVRVSGGRAAENWLKILLQSYVALGDANGTAATTEKLVSQYPTPENWKLMASSLRRQASGDDATAMNVYRLMNELKLMDKAEICTEASITAILAGVPAEAVRFMESCNELKLFMPADAPRAKKILADAQGKVAAQKPNLATLAKQASASTSGQDEINVGSVLLSYGDAEQALAAGKRALTKGGNADEAYMLIGRAYLQLKNGAEARKAFSQVKGSSAASIAKLWNIHASRS